MKQKKGVALIWVLVLSTILIMISSTMVSYIIKDSQFSVRIEESTRVYAAAKSGIDWGQWRLSNGGSAPTFNPYEYEFDLLDSDGNTDTRVVFSNVTGGTTIESTATYKNVTRKLRYTYTNNAGTIITPIGPTKENINDTSVGNNSESFVLQYDFWVDQPSANHPYSFGLQDAAGTNMLYARLDSVSGQIFLGHKVGSEIESTTTGFNVYSDTNRNDPYNYRVILKYIKNTAAKLSIQQRDPLTGGYDCLASISEDLSGVEMGNLSNLYAETSSGSVAYTTTGTAGDGSYIGISSSTPVLADIIDNIYIKK